MKNKIICLVLSLVLVGGLMGANGAYAWFVLSSGGSSGGAGGEHNFSTGNVGIIVSGDFDKDYETIVPEDELLCTFNSEDESGAAALGKITDFTNCKMFLESTSTVDSQFRIKIEYEYGKDESGNDKIYYFDNSVTSPLTVKFTDSTLWTYYDGYFYYGEFDETTNSSSVISAFDPEKNPTPLLIPLFDSIRYSGENTENTQIAGKKLTVKVILEARQSEFVDWTAFGEINNENTENT